MISIKKVIDKKRWRKKITLPFEKRNSYRILNDLLKMKDDSNSDFTLYQRRQLIAILKHAFTHCNYYNQIFTSIDLNIETLENFHSIPFLDKWTIRQNMEQICTDNLDAYNYHIAYTGGSTGDPLEFPRNHFVSFMEEAHYMYSYAMMGHVPGDVIAAFGGWRIDQKLVKQGIYWNYNPTGSNFPYGRIFYSSQYFTQDTISSYIDNVLLVKPAILRGFPSFISQLAEYISANNIDIGFHIKGIQLTAEAAYDSQLAIIRKAFKAPIFRQYGHTESSVFALTEPDDESYTCSPFYGLTEVIKSDGKPAKEGEIGEIVVTGFHNLVMPFIRYRTGDIAVYAGTDRGMVRFSRLEGREQDYLVNRKGEKIDPCPLAWANGENIYKNIRQWQLVQETPGMIVIRIVKAPEFCEKDEMAIQNCFNSSAELDVCFKYMDKIPLTDRGKQRFIQQNIICK